MILDDTDLLTPTLKHVDAKRVAVLQAFRHVDCQTANCVITLADAGLDVDFFLYNDWDPWLFVERSTLEPWSKLRLHDLCNSAPPQRVEAGQNGKPARLLGSARAARFVKKWLSPRLSTAQQMWWLLLGLDNNILPPWLLQRTYELMAGKQYACAIGLEKAGVVWAGQVASRLKLPLYYYSLELYVEDYQREVLGRSLAFRRLRSAERKYHQRARGTIIQDLDRANVLLNANRVPRSSNTLYYVPVSMLGKPYQTRSYYLHEKLNISKEKRLILYFGQIWDKRHVLEVSQAAQRFPENWLLVIHGVDWYKATEKIKSIDEAQRVVVSLDRVPSDHLPRLVASADIGLAFYSALTQNDKLTAFSSEKMALYMQCGVPFIAFNYPGYQRLAEQDQCGRTIASMEELPDAIAAIFGSYDEYRQRAYDAFVRHFSYAPNFAKVIDAIRNL